MNKIQSKKTAVNTSGTILKAAPGSGALEIKSFAPWLISVGMVSEGTDIPRLQVCCHLSRIYTELHFRQVLGRILRKRPQDSHPQATLIVPAHPELSEFAAILKAEIPEHVSVVWRKKKGGSLILRDPHEFSM